MRVTVGTGGNTVPERGREKEAATDNAGAF